MMSRAACKLLLIGGLATLFNACDGEMPQNPPGTEPGPGFPDNGTPDNGTPDNGTPDDGSAPDTPEVSGDVCSGGSSRYYTESGPYGMRLTSLTNAEGLTYEVYTPDPERLDCRTPVVGFAMGTGAPAFAYQFHYEHLASWGITVIVDATLTGQYDGGTLRRAIDDLYADPAFSGFLSDRAGTIGHSQGGGAAVSASAHPKVQAVVGFMPALVPTGLTKPGLYLGGTVDHWGTVTDPVHPYNATNGTAYMAKITGADHTNPAIHGTYPFLKSPPPPQPAMFRSAATGWFRCHLSGDAGACAMFGPKDCSGLYTVANEQWEQCDGK